MAQANLVKLRLRLRIFLRKSEAIFSTLDDLRLLRDFPEEDSLKIQVKKKVERLPSFRLIISHCGEGTLLRGGRTEGFRRHPSASTGFTVELG